MQEDASVTRALRTKHSDEGEKNGSKVTLEEVWLALVRREWTVGTKGKRQVECGIQS